MKRLLPALLLLGTSLYGTLQATEKVWIDQNFDDRDFFPPGLIEGVGMRKTTAGGWKFGNANGLEIVTAPVVSGPHALKITRSGSNGTIDFFRESPIPGNSDYTVSFKLYLPPGNHFCMWLTDDGSKPFGGILLTADVEMAAYKKDAKTEFSWAECDGIIPPADRFFQVGLAISANEQSYVITLSELDGKLIGQTGPIAFLERSQLRTLRLIDSLPQGNYSVIDDLKIVYSTGASLAGRREHAAEAAENGQRTITGEGKLELILNTSATLSSLTVDFSGKPESVSASALDSMGRWNQLGEQKGPFDGNRAQLDFEPVSGIKKVELTVHSAAGAAIEKIGLYSPPERSGNELSEAFLQKVYGEFRLPAYDPSYPDMQTAGLHLVNTQSAPLKVNLSLTDREGQPVAAIPEREIELAPGETVVDFALDKIADGDYLAVIRELSADGSTGGSFRRMLRVRTQPEIAPLTLPFSATGKKLFFPDMRYIESAAGVEFFTAAAELREIMRSGTAYDSAILQGQAIWPEPDGTLVAEYCTLNRDWKADSSQKHTVISKDRGLTWEKISGDRQRDWSRMPLNPFSGTDTPETAKPDWEPKPVNGKRHYRFYDPQTDGPVQLNQVKMVWVTTMQSDEMWYVGADFGDLIKPIPCATYPVWYPANGDVVLLSKDPILVSSNTPGEFERPNSSSDLGGGQWLTDDGRTLCYASGRALRRYDPYDPAWDNAPSTLRMMTLLRTTDGIHWQETFFGVPSEKQPFADQHYGGYPVRIKDGDGFQVYYLNRYNAWDQRLSTVVLYSWDGINWRRNHESGDFSGDPEPGSWNYGSSFTVPTGFELDGTVYQLINWAASFTHCEAEITQMCGDIANIDGERLKNFFSYRKRMSEWPLFSKLYDRSYDKWAENLRRSTTSAGMMVFRRDGYFGVRGGELVTHPFRAPGAALTANAVVKPGGALTVTLLDEAGIPVSGYCARVTGDGVNLPVFERLPEGVFKLKVELDHAELYTLNF